MTDLDGFMPDEAFELIEEFGKSVEYLLVTAGQGADDYDTETGKTKPEETPVEGVKILPPEGYSSYSVSGSNGLIETSDKKLTTSPLYFETQQPTSGDKISFDGATYTLVKVDAIYSGELICLYIFQARG